MHKVIRWAFEVQGLYAVAGTVTNAPRPSAAGRHLHPGPAATFGSLALRRYRVWAGQLRSGLARLGYPPVRFRCSALVASRPKRDRRVRRQYFREGRKPRQSTGNECCSHRLVARMAQWQSCPPKWNDTKERSGNCAPSPQARPAKPLAQVRSLLNLISRSQPTAIQHPLSGAGYRNLRGRCRQHGRERPDHHDDVVPVQPIAHGTH